MALLRELPTAQPFVVLGTIHAPDVEWTAHYTTEDLHEAMRREAASVGADALVDFRTREQPTVQTTHYYYASGTYAYSTRVPFKGLHAWAEAVLFVTEEERQQLEPTAK